MPPSASALPQCVCGERHRHQKPLTQFGPGSAARRLVGGEGIGAVPASAVCAWAPVLRSRGWFASGPL